MSHEATLIYSETLLRQAVFAFWRRSVGVGFLVALLVASLGLGLLVTQGVASWLAGALAAVLVRCGCLRRSLSQIAAQVPPDGQASSHVPRGRVLIPYEFGHRHDNASVVRRQRAVAVP